MAQHLPIDLPELNRIFARAAGQTRMMVQQKLLSISELAELDGLFQQATSGDGSGWKLLRDPKFMVDARIKEKSGSWAANRGKSQVQAKDEYVAMVESLSDKYHVVYPPSRCASIASVSTCYTNMSN